MAQLHCNFFSYSLGYGVDLTILLPSMSPCDMGDPGKRTHRIPAKYPVLYLLHGHGNDYMSWNRFTSAERYAEERRIAVVTVSVGNKGYMNASYGEHYYDFIARELPEFVRANFPISERSEDTYIAGASMGGYGALAHTLGHAGDYRAAGAFSPAIRISGERLGHEMPPMMDLDELLAKARAEGEPLPELFFCVGTEDHLLAGMDAFHQRLDLQGISHRYDRVAGFGHEWGFWEYELPLFLDWLPRTDPYAAMERRKM